MYFGDFFAQFRDKFGDQARHGYSIITEKPSTLQLWKAFDVVSSNVETRSHRAFPHTQPELRLKASVCPPSVELR
jgi:hypothetical protein